MNKSVGRDGSPSRPQDDVCYNGRGRDGSPNRPNDGRLGEASPGLWQKCAASGEAISSCATNLCIFRRTLAVYRVLTMYQVVQNK